MCFVCTASPYIFFNDDVITLCLDPSQTQLRHVTATTKENYMLLFVLQKLLSLLALPTLLAFLVVLSLYTVRKVYEHAPSLLCFYCISVAELRHVLMNTAAVWVCFSGFVCMQIFLETTMCLEKNKKIKDCIGEALPSCGWALSRYSDPAFSDLMLPSHRMWNNNAFMGFQTLLSAEPLWLKLFT